MNKLNKIDPRMSKLTLSNSTNTLLFANPSFTDKTSTFILDATIEYTLSTKLFDETIFEVKYIAIYMVLYIYIFIYMVFTTEEFFEVAIASWPEWDLNPRPLNSVQTV